MYARFMSVCLCLQAHAMACVYVFLSVCVHGEHRKDRKLTPQTTASEFQTRTNTAKQMHFKQEEMMLNVSINILLLLRQICGQSSNVKKSGVICLSSEDFGRLSSCVTYLILQQNR